MALGYAQGSIAGVNLEDANATPCKVLILDGANLKPTMIGSSQAAADGTIYTQIYVVTSGAGFGVKIEFCPPAVLNNIIDTINTAMVGAGNFNVTLADDIHTISATVVPDFSQGWVKYPPQRTHVDVIKDVEFRFLTVA